MTLPRLTILSKEGCCLCTEAKQVAERVMRDVPFELEVIDLADDEELKSRYEYEVPVVFLNGKKIFKYKLTEAALAARLHRLDPPE